MTADEIFIYVLLIACVAIVAGLAIHSRRNPPQVDEGAAGAGADAEAIDDEAPVRRRGESARRMAR